MAHGLGVVGAHAGAPLQQAVDDVQCRRLADVVGVGLEGQSPQGDGLALQVAAEVAVHLVHQHLLLAVVDAHHGVEDAEVVAELAGGHGQGLHVLREAGAPVAYAGEEEALADAAVGADADAHHVHVGAHPFAEVGDLVHEGDAGGEVGVGGVLGHLGRALVHEDDGVALSHEGLVQLVHHLAGALGTGAHHHAVGLHEIVHGDALAQELGVRHHVEEFGGEALGQGGVHLLGGAHGHGALVDHYGVLLDQAAQLLGHAEDVAEVGRAVLAGRRGQGQEDDLRLGDGVGEVLLGILDLLGERRGVEFGHGDGDLGQQRQALRIDLNHAALDEDAVGRAAVLVDGDNARLQRREHRRVAREDAHLALGSGNGDRGHAP